ncbi:MAG: LSU ribosomal protein L21p [uncultured Thermomicrobiales bacterium]|uniref:Large ribosomal subunit protein bL21 n=1 Tax=uncultured Thermomicrobiales bacterium TaxID=1645740 RepID=A0A6J4UV87_9BACT|nr:MAG: LSU ribosomal protein L21p [uncultured Thermomicrobiales bacterium]
MTDPNERQVADDLEQNPERHPDDAASPDVVVEEPAAAQDDEPVEGATAEVAPLLPTEGDVPPAASAAVPASAVVAAARGAFKRPRGPKPSPLTKPLPPYAVIETGGKQYRVSVGDRISVEKLPVDAGGTITIDRVLLLGGDGSTRVGTPTVAGAAVQATVEEQYRGEKIVIFKYKAKKGYRRRTGHRQSLTRLAITAITG